MNDAKRYLVSTVSGCLLLFVCTSIYVVLRKNGWGDIHIAIPTSPRAVLVVLAIGFGIFMSSEIEGVSGYFAMLYLAFGTHYLIVRFIGYQDLVAKMPDIYLITAILLSMLLNRELILPRAMRGMTRGR